MNQAPMEEAKVVVVGAGPAGLAAAACLNNLGIPNIVLEREDCYASLWKKKAYDCVKLHLAKEYCELPHMHFPSDAPTYVPKAGFISYLDNYVSHFGISPRYHGLVESAWYSEKDGKWNIKVNNTELNKQEMYEANFLVVATGENKVGFIPKFDGLESFGGECIHSNMFRNGTSFRGKDVLVVGSGNSGMEIAYNLCVSGAKASIVCRSPVHILTKDIVYLGMNLLNFLPCNLVDSIVVNLGRMKFGDLSDYGLERPVQGPFLEKSLTGRSPTIDVGAVDKIKAKEIQVFPGIKCVRKKEIEFVNGKSSTFDTIIFATGYKSTVKHWLKDGEDLFDSETGMPKSGLPKPWKGRNGLYCIGFARKGLFGISKDAQNIAKDISSYFTQEKSVNL